jgi:class I fructose-bisphosphate aldolase/fructose-bisphosphate aldolase/2-amino-3,7-dideoxy-D-threo-hept-6-ulosonate synthase
MDGVAKKIRWSRFLDRHSGRGIIVPIDHGLTIGPLPGLDGMAQVARWIVHPGITGVIAHKGMVERLGSRDLLRGVGVMVHLNGMTSLAPEPDRKERLTSIEAALRLGADAVSLQLNFDGTNDAHNLTQLGAVVDEAQRHGLPVLTMLYDKVACDGEEQRTKRLRQLTRACVELGTDALKLAAPADASQLAALCARRSRCCASRTRWWRAAPPACASGATSSSASPPPRSSPGCRRSCSPPAALCRRPAIRLPPA